MNNKVKLLSIFVSLGLVLIHVSKASAQDTLTLSLEGAVKYALQNNTDIRNALLDLQSANRKIWETTAIGLPQVKRPNIAISLKFQSCLLVHFSIQGFYRPTVLLLPKTLPMLMWSRRRSNWGLRKAQLLILR